MTDEQWLAVLDVTLTGTFRCTRAALRQMVAQGHGGAVVNNASVLGWRAQPGQAHYAAAKAGVMALTRCAALDVARHGIRVNAVAPSLAIHPFLAKVTSEELLAELAGQGGVRARGPAVGGRQRDRLPGQRLRLLPDRRGACRSAASTPDRHRRLTSGPGICQPGLQAEVDAERLVEFGDERSWQLALPVGRPARRHANGPARPAPWSRGAGRSGGRAAGPGTGRHGQCWRSRAQR